MADSYGYFVQVLCFAGIAVGTQALQVEDKLKWLSVARYVVYILSIACVGEASSLAAGLWRRERGGARRAAAAARGYALLALASVAALLLCDQPVFQQDFVFVFLGYLLVKYPEMAEGGDQSSPAAARKNRDTGELTKKSINYGVGMACSYFEGYLMHILPSDGHKFVGFEENIRSLEDHEGVLFPVKKMFIVVTKNLYSPPDLKEFNRGTDVPYLESFNILPEIKKSVAGVKDRIYHNTAYKVYRAGAAPVCLTVECASPLHTLYKVISNRRLYDELAEIDIEEVKDDFCSTLKSILEKSHECKGKCEFIFYDHEDPSQNLAEILLKRIAELCPGFDEKIQRRRAQNAPE